MTISSLRSIWAPLFAWMIVGGALGCAPAVNIGALPQVSPDAASCGVTTLASGLQMPGALALQSDALYFVVEGATTEVGAIIEKVPLGGGDPLVLANMQERSTPLVTDGTDLYFVDSIPSKLFKMPAGGGMPSTIIDTYVSTFAVDAAGVYFGEGVDTIKKMPVQGGSATTLTSEAGFVERMVVDAANVYWINGSGSMAKVMRLPLGGGTPTAVVSDQPSIMAIAVDGANLYWLSDGPNSDDPGPHGSLMKAPIDGSAPPTTLASGQSDPTAIVVSDGYVYWGGGGIVPTDVMRVSVLGGTPESIASSLIGTNGLVACPGGVCWTDAAHGTVMRYEACSP